MVRIWKNDVDIREMFTFTAGPTPSVVLSFPRPLSSMPVNCAFSRPPKRRRPLADVDGEGHERKKKRRLRLFLITSRLSRPFSAPATNIVDRGISKIAVWAKNKALGRNVLRKAAIMNRIKREAEARREVEQRHLEVARQASLKQQCHIGKISRRCYIPMPPSPLGLSNYDALDLEDDLYHDELGDESNESNIYSDFNILRTGTTVQDNYDYLDELDGIPHELPEDRRPPTPPDEKIVEMLREKERQKEISFVKFS